MRRVFAAVAASAALLLLGVPAGASTGSTVTVPWLEPHGGTTWDTATWDTATWPQLNTPIPECTESGEQSWQVDVYDASTPAKAARIAYLQGLTHLLAPGSSPASDTDVDVVLSWTFVTPPKCVVPSTESSVPSSLPSSSSSLPNSSSSSDSPSEPPSTDTEPTGSTGSTPPTASSSSTPDSSPSSEPSESGGPSSSNSSSGSSPATSSTSVSSAPTSSSSRPVGTSSSTPSKGTKPPSSKSSLRPAPSSSNGSSTSCSPGSIRLGSATSRAVARLTGGGTTPLDVRAVPLASTGASRSTGYLAAGGVGLLLAGAAVLLLLGHRRAGGHR